jgi:hypothetical protein
MYAKYSSRETILTSPTGLNSFVEPCYLVYDIQNPRLDVALADLKSLLQVRTMDVDLTDRCRQKRIERVRLMNDALELAVSVSQKVYNIYTLTQTEDDHYRECGAVSSYSLAVFSACC